MPAEDDLGHQRPGPPGFLARNKLAVGVAGLAMGALLAYLAASGSWASAERDVMNNELSAIAKEEVQNSLAAAGFVKAAHAAHAQPAGSLPDIAPEDCVDREADCRGWAAAGECLNNAAYMVGNEEAGVGACPAACGVCGDAVEAAASAECRDIHAECASLRDAGECTNNPDWMQGTEDFEGQCRLTCGSCTPEVDPFIADFSLPGQEGGAADAGDGGQAAPGGDGSGASWLGGASYAAQADSGCEDKSASCPTWAEDGMCEENRSYMLGGMGKEGQCRRSCGACHVAGDAAAVAVPRSAAIVNIAGPGQSLAEWPLQWPVKVMADKKVCVGMTTVPCERGLYKPAVVNIQPDDRQRASPGIGGPTGCHEAWATMMNQDSDLPGALVLIYTLRKYSTQDRDMLVFVSANVTAAPVEALQGACVQVMRVAEPYDPSTHVGFNKMSMWLAEEYSRIAYFDPSVWFRKNMEAVWEAQAPAAVEAPRHPRVVHEVFNDGAFLFEPSRETFFDMLRQAATIDSAEERDDGSVIYMAKLFFTGYFVHWSTISAALLEHESKLVELLHHEAVESRLHMVIKSMPPYSAYTTLEYGMIQALGIQNGDGVPPWLPGWRIPCSYPCPLRRDQHLWEAVSEEWWHYYYSLISFSLPTTRASMRLLEPHDPMGLFDKNEFEHCLPISCDVPNNFTATLTSFSEVMHTLQEKHESAVLRGTAAGGKAKAAAAKRGKKVSSKKHGRRRLLLADGAR
eukprot:jgi/Tetstr1/462586/TSEL_007572.t1